MSKIFFDTNVFIYLFEDYEPFQQYGRRVLAEDGRAGRQVGHFGNDAWRTSGQADETRTASLIEQYDRPSGHVRR